ncbi:RnfABCDGE type electron transport complex subunit D [Entomospira culicis]|uniref:RnfABCDGE type electron transport complex subunit D n=1 Tax=Entomospira culicis TaxID=2719989 RepID=A0A968KUU4_9SPIO|nr:RnfABCDGE type electron transport complex subunit D [Entomospira culicis]NIZ19610.1 RnfABCDGE type electron transport complex subunit D [Entomospira culicis]NIZ69485.1 RnfABCDGE type electron transport complex subunit D [Entomospira culicis]WDI36600.1 RnfABCDGE type electron transport complex subunit D [Entomospira culicis]WDI38228.1 RnfABCDGE type electron transport complex subunit D [Entomospira culicis]
MEILFSGVKSAPFIRSWQRTSLQMGLMTLALGLQLILAWLLEGQGEILLRWGILLAMSTGLELLMNLLYRKFMLLDGTAWVSATILALLLPIQLFDPWTLFSIAFFTIIIGKWAIGGMGANYLNPAMVGLLYYLLSTPYAGLATLWSNPILAGVLVASWLILTLLGIINGSVSLSAILSYLSLAYLLSMMAGESFTPLASGGSWLFLALFVAPNPSSIPMRLIGKIFYGLLIGFLSALFFWGYQLGDLSFVVAILIANMVSPVIHRHTLGRTFSKQKLGRHRT